MPRNNLRRFNNDNTSDFFRQMKRNVSYIVKILKTDASHFEPFEYFIDYDFDVMIQFYVFQKKKLFSLEREFVSSEIGDYFDLICPLQETLSYIEQDFIYWWNEAVDLLNFIAQSKRYPLIISMKDIVDCNEFTEQQ